MPARLKEACQNLEIGEGPNIEFKHLQIGEQRGHVPEGRPGLAVRIQHFGDIVDEWNRLQ